MYLKSHQTSNNNIQVNRSPRSSASASTSNLSRRKIVAISKSRRSTVSTLLILPLINISQISKTGRFDSTGKLTLRAPCRVKYIISQPRQRP